MASSTSKPRRPRGKTLIALLTTTVALTAGAQALAPAPAAAFQTECVEVGNCDGGAGGGAPSDGSGSGDYGDDGSGFGNDLGFGSGGGSTSNDNGGASNDDNGGCSVDYFGVCLLGPEAATSDQDQSAKSLPNELGDPQQREAVFQALEEERRQRDADRELRQFVDDRARRALDDFDPDRDIWRAAKCGSTDYPLRCGIFWAYTRQRVKCQNLEDEPQSSDLGWRVETCRNTADALSDLLHDLVNVGARSKKKQWSAQKN